MQARMLSLTIEFLAEDDRSVRFMSSLAALTQLHAKTAHEL